MDNGYWTINDVQWPMHNEQLIMYNGSTTMDKCHKTIYHGDSLLENGQWKINIEQKFMDNKKWSMEN